MGARAAAIATRVMRCSVRIAEVFHTASSVRFRFASNAGRFHRARRVAKLCASIAASKAASIARSVTTNSAGRARTCRR